MAKKNQSLIMKILFYIGILIVASWWGYRIFRPPKQESARDLPTLNSVLPFELTERNGKPLSLDQLKGKVWVAHFFSIECSGSCLNITAQVYALHKRLENNTQFRVVSFSINPKGDSVEKINEYAKRFKASPTRWLFVTGNFENVHNLLYKSFKIFLGEPNQKEHPKEHTNRVALVDKKGNVRSSYDILDGRAVKKIIRDVNILIQE